MTIGYVLIVAILVLGGVIATLGDRIGMKVGKARLTLFNLRPRQTATLVSVITGSLISASTLGILFAVSSQLRKGVFEFEEVQSDLREAQTDLQKVQRDRKRIENELEEAQSRQKKAQQRLQEINNSLNAAVERQRQTQSQLNQTQSELQQSEQSYAQAQRQLRQLSQQEQELQQEVQQLQSERQALIEREREIRALIEERDREINQRDTAIARQKSLLEELAAQQDYLSTEVRRLEREAQGLRQGNLALARNEVLASGVFRVEQPEAAVDAIRQILQEANRTALRNILPNFNDPEQQIIFITNPEVQQLVDQVDDGQTYVVRILSAANYLVGEPCVLEEGDPCIQVFWDAVPNDLIFDTGDVVAATPIERENLTTQGLRERLYLLLATSQFRSRQAGVVVDDVDVAGRPETIFRFLEQVQRYGQPVSLQAIATQPIYASGPVLVDLVAVQDGKILFQTRLSDPFLPPTGSR